MSKLLPIEKAKEILANNESRKLTIIEEVNKSIEHQSQNGFSYCSMPANLSDFERVWLIEQLTIHNYNVSESANQISWGS